MSGHTFLKKRKRENMPSTTTFLAAPKFFHRKRSSSHSQSRDDVDDFLSSDLELSFASSVSINSPSRDDNLARTLDSEYAEPMDISPLPPQKTLQPIIQRPLAQTRPRAFTTAARLFNDVSNKAATVLAPSPSIVDSNKSSSKRTQRPTLPTQWLMPSNPDTSGNVFNVSSVDDDAMDVDDSSYAKQLPPAIFSLPTEPESAATITTFNHFFFDTTSPQREAQSPVHHQTKKRRSLSPEATRYHDDDDNEPSSPILPSSPAASKLERMASNSILAKAGKPTLEGLGNPSNGLKRPRRPALSAMVYPSSSIGLQSAYPVLSSENNCGENQVDNALPPARRAFSAMIPPSSLEDQYSDESSFCSADMSSPAQAYAKRQQMKTIRRCDGTDDFRPLTGATAMIMKESPSSKFMRPGIPGFGDNEAHGKALPCHRVSEDGLMRISPQTLDKLIRGDFESKIHEYHIIDCRFDYEYQGGHIENAVNINTVAAVEEILLGPSLFKPKPSVSGDDNKKTVLIFHCEFSAKRAPTFAKHLRAKDRAMNNHVYPKVHYPELYILEGGYSRYFKESGARCDPPGGYVPMDDPNHAASRRGDLDQFRKAKFGRHRSYAYGDMAKQSSSSQQQTSKRNSAPTAAPPPMFAAGHAARTRRGGSTSLLTLPEDANTTADGDDTDIDLGDSPCPPPTKTTTLKSKKLTRGPLARAETYGPGRMPY
ncbi:hypothetical protein E1B28_008762 [Marasmius oreades]|uniref:M-phase inducer phosphatase n=1 Tax=Marasmius oreades TaxID=181124 RepID=A0A9P7USQ1_9AGAR|nr:uncharacterized protein E1B28_008762 [Marasmius oreades]KAG7092405.1 hypothetical protein E1B28_008762 [Marasmius oreades]